MMDDDDDDNIEIVVNTWNGFDDDQISQYSAMFLELGETLAQTGLLEEGPEPGINISVKDEHGVQYVLEVYLTDIIPEDESAKKPPFLTVVH